MASQKSCCASGVRLNGIGKGLMCAGLLGGALLATPGYAVTFEYSGYLREHISVGLQDVPGFDAAGRDFDSKGELSMVRHSGKVEAKLDFGGGFEIIGIGRSTREHHTKYERSLQNSTKSNPLLLSDEFNPGVPQPPACAFVPGGVCGGLGLGSVGAGGPPIPVLGQQTQVNVGVFGLGATRDIFPDYDADELRELYAKFNVAERFHFKLGRQQVVWGETDFFRAMDIINGYDLRWRSFLETENEELRKPLIIGNLEIDVPEMDGTLQLIYRPGWDEGEEMGTDVPLAGGRWAPLPGFGATTSVFGPLNYHHKSGDENDANYGLRWSGTFNQIGYSLAYYRGLTNDLILNRNPSAGGSTFNSTFEGGTDLGEAIYPWVETFGATFNAYTETLDAVLRGELALTKNQPLNTGTRTFVDVGAAALGCSDVRGAFGGTGFGCALLGGPGAPPVVFPGPPFTPPTLFPVLRNSPKDNIAAGGTGTTPFLPGAPYTPGDGTALLTLSNPGLAPVVEKDVLKLMFGFDKNLNWAPQVFGTERPALWTMQLFDTWVLDYKKSDDIVDLFGYGARKREHTTILTNAFFLNYKYDTVNPSLAVGFDLGNFDAFAVPALDLVYGDHWRVRLEADLLFPKHTNKDNLGSTNSRGRADHDTRLLGTLGNHDQLSLRVQYQF